MTERSHTETRHARAGWVLFVIYVIFYSGFVIISAFAPEKMKLDIGGVNLAVAYGMGLIVLAFFLALVFMFVTRTRRNGEGRA